MMKKRRALSGILMLVTVAWGARAEGSMSVSEAVKLALEKNLSLGREALDLAAKKRSADSSYNLLYPSLSVGAGLTRLNSSSGAGTAYGELSASLSLSPTIGLEMKERKLAYESGLLSYAEAQRGVELEVRLSFNSILLDEAKLALARQNEERERKNYEQVKAKYSAGLATELELLSAEVSFEEKGPLVESAGVTLEDERAAFRLLLGLEPSQELALSGSLDSASAVTEASVNSVFEAAKGRESLSVQALRKSLETARASAKLASVDLASPSLSVSGKFYPEYPDLSSSAHTDGGSLSLSLSLPLDGLLPASSSRLSLAAAEDAVKKAESLLASGKAESASAVASSLRAVKSAAASLATLQRSVVLAQKKYDLTYEAYQKGVKELSDLEDAANSLDSAKVEVLSQEYTLLSEALSLESELGLDFGSIGR